MSTLVAALTLGRARAESRMTETVTVGVYQDGTDENGDPTSVLVSTRYTGKGRVKYPSLTVTEGDQPSPVQSQRPELHLPSGTVLVEGEEAVVSASSVDASLVGRRYRIAGNSQAGQTTAARFPLVELS